MRWVLTAIAATVLLASCGEDDPVGPTGPSIYGTYELQSIGGRSLPCCESMRVDGEQGVYIVREIESGAWNLTEDDTWSATWTVHTRFLSLGGSQFDEATDTVPFGGGSYVKSEADLLFTSSDGNTYSGWVSGPVLTVMLEDDLPVVYRK